MDIPILLGISSDRLCAATNLLTWILCATMKGCVEQQSEWRAFDVPWNEVNLLVRTFSFQAQKEVT